MKKTSKMFNIQVKKKLIYLEDLRDQNIKINDSIQKDEKVEVSVVEKNYPNKSDASKSPDVITETVCYFL
jgi:hypothetical protein